MQMVRVAFHTLVLKLIICSQECPVLLIGGVAQSDDDQVVVSSDEASLTISVEASKKTDVTIVCQYELLRKDTALVLDCRSM